MLKRVYNIVSIIVAFGMLIFAIPQVEIGQGWTMPTVFAVVWICFALLVIAAHLHRVIGVDEHTEKELEQIRLHKRIQLQQLFMGAKKQPHSQKR